MGSFTLALTTGIVTVSVENRGAAPAEIEAAICLRLEQAVEGIEGIAKLTSRAGESRCTLTVELKDDINKFLALNRIKSNVDAIDTFPVEAEKPVVSQQVWRGRVVELVLTGNLTERTLKELAREVRDEIRALPGISLVETGYQRPYEISIEVSEHTLRRHGLTLGDVATSIRKYSLDLPAGELKTQAGDIIVRTRGQAYRADDFTDIPVLTATDGSVLRLGDVAVINDGFEESDNLVRLDGGPAATVRVYRVGDEDIISMAETVFDYIREKRQNLPAGVELTAWIDESRSLEDRLDTLRSTALSGLTLVMISLALLLQFRLALWVAAGILIALNGALMLLPYLDISINSASIMAFILVIGIVVDDAIVVGERIFAHEDGQDPVQAAINGTTEVSIPVIFGVMTSAAAFLPMLLASGDAAIVFRQIGGVVIVALLFSLLEAMFILPSHIANRSRKVVDRSFGRTWGKLQTTLSGVLAYLTEEVYRPCLYRIMNWRYSFASLAAGALIITMALILSGRIVFQFVPPAEGDYIYATVELPAGIAVEQTIAVVAEVEQAANITREFYNGNLSTGSPPVVKRVMSTVGVGISRPGALPMSAPLGQANIAEIILELAPPTERNGITSSKVLNTWRDNLGAIVGAVDINFSADIFSFGEAINIEFTGADLDELQSAAYTLQNYLNKFPGVYDIGDTIRIGKQELMLELLPNAETLGLTLFDIANQVRQALHGEEIHRVQRGEDDVRVMVRYPQSERRSIGNLETMYIRTHDGVEIPFQSVARFIEARGLVSIDRIDHRRAVNVTASVDRNVASPEAIVAEVKRSIMPEILKHHAGVDYRLSGEQEMRLESLDDLAASLVLALLLIFMLLAIPLHSYTQPLIIMSVIPFGGLGAILGHFILGWNLMFFSLLGMVALAGVVINSSLILVDCINKLRNNGAAITEAVLAAGTTRFRPIALTSITTFVGLSPLIATANPATIMFVPMAISLAFGIVFSTVVTLLLVPCIYLIWDDIASCFRQLPAAQKQFSEM